MQKVNMNYKTNKLLGYPISFLAAICYGTASFLGKILVSQSITPIVVGIYAIFFGSIVLAVLARKEIPSIGKAGLKSLIFMSLAGISGSFAITVFFWGVDIGSLTTIAPLVSLQALVAMTLTHLFLHKLERITPRIAVGTLLVSIGIALIIITSNNV